jgi:hypothetical protein
MFCTAFKKFKNCVAVTGFCTEGKYAIFFLFQCAKSRKFIFCPRIIQLLQLAYEGFGCVLNEDPSVICLV